MGFGGLRGNKKLGRQSSPGMRNKKNHEDTMTSNLIPVDLSICSKSITNSIKEHDLFTVINLAPVEEKNLLTYKRRKKKNCLSVDNEEAHSISLQVQENRSKRVVSGSCLDTALLLMENKGETVSEHVKYKDNLNVPKSVMRESDSSLEKNSETPSNVLSASFNKLEKNKKLELASLDVAESSSMKDAPSRSLKTYKKKKKVVDLSSEEKASEDALVRDSSAKKLKQPEECSLCSEEDLVREKSPLAWENNLVIKESILLGGCNKEDNLLDMLTYSPGRAPIRCIRRKLLVLDINGLLADIVSFVPHGYKPDTEIARKALFKRPFCDDFLKFCFEKFDVGVWSSRTKRNVDSVVDFLLGDMQQNLLFCWNQSHCTGTGFSTIENRNKPLILKELNKLWDKLEPDLPWEKGVYNESNTLLLDDSPYKALRNPPHTAVFPCPYMFKATNDISLGPGGDLRVYLEGLAMAEDVQKYVKQHHLGQRAITNTNPSWRFYRKVICTQNHSYHSRPTQRRYR